MKRWLFIAGFIALALPSMAGAEEVLYIRNELSSGMSAYLDCLEITPTSIEYWEGNCFFRKGKWNWTNFHYFHRSLSKSEWRSLQSAVQAQALHSLPATIGHPDEVDQGAECLTIQTDQDTKSVNLDPFIEVPATAALQKRLTELRLQIQTDLKSQSGKSGGKPAASGH